MAPKNSDYNGTSRPAGRSAAGIDAARQITATAALEDRWCAPIYALTAACAKEDTDLCLDAGMTGHFSKPMNASILAKVEAHLKAGRVSRLAFQKLRRDSRAASGVRRVDTANHGAAGAAIRTTMSDRSSVADSATSAREAAGEIAPAPEPAKL